MLQYLPLLQIPPISIELYLLPPFVRGQAGSCPSSQTKGSLTIGYGSNGSDKVRPDGSGPFAYECRPGQDMDVDY